MNIDYSIPSALRRRTARNKEGADQQAALLRDHVRQAGRSPFYRKRLRDLAINIDDITSVAGLAGLPLTERRDLDRADNAFHAAPDSAMADIALTSGTTGNSVVVPYTAQDLKRLAFNETMAFWGAGIRPTDRILICVTLDRCFIAGLAYYSGLIELGASVIRSGPGQPARQWELIQRLRPTCLVGVPSFLLNVAQWGESHGHSPTTAGISSLVTIGEPVRRPDHSLTPLGADLEKAWQARVYSSYGATELETAFCECHAGRGGHIHPELTLVEIIDEHGSPLPNGQPGEVVVTPLGVEGFPLLRFRTGDVARLFREPCTCGWQTPRLGPIEGRLAQRLKFRGTTLYPETIFQTLEEMPAVRAAYVEVRASYDLADEVTVVIGADEGLAGETVADFLQARLRVKPEIVIRPTPVVLDVMRKPGDRKARRFFDLRKH